MNFRTKLFTATSMYALGAIGVAAIGTYGTSVAAAQSDTESNQASEIDAVDAGDTVEAGYDANTFRLHLTPSSDKLAQCMPEAGVNVAVRLTTNQDGFDRFTVRGQHLPPNRDFTVFLLEQAGSPLGAAEYIGDLHTKANGTGQNTFRLIVQEAFSSTLVNGQRARVDLNRVGMWFADPKDDDFCLGPNSPVTPFDGDNEAGVQAFNSANADPLPAP
jgi:hypothetical protein